jgi:hypothetical protein
MSAAVKIFLSIRQARLMAGNKFKITAGDRRPDKDENLYFKVIDGKINEHEISDLSRIVKYDTDPFVSTVRKLLQLNNAKNVLFYIHGYHPFENTLHTSLLDELAEHYSSTESQKQLMQIYFSAGQTGV